MAELTLSPRWVEASQGEPEISATVAWLDIAINGFSLTRHEDIWAKTVRDHVLVSVYPLAMWFVGSWWRLNHEPLPIIRQPGHGWRMTHELGAANHGYVWPHVVFMPEGETMQVWAGSTLAPGQSVQYLQGLDAPRPLALQSFQQSIQNFVAQVLDRLDAKQLATTDLMNLWGVLQEDLADPATTRRRKLEAELGFDPEECPEDFLETILKWGLRMGDTALSEIAPAIASQDEEPVVTALEKLADTRGVVGTPEVSAATIEHATYGLPWERAVHDARALRQSIGNISEPIKSHDLYQLLGLSRSAALKAPIGEKHLPVAVAMLTKSNQVKFVPRKRNATGQRFEFARFLGEYMRQSNHKERWLVSTDLSTSRQKYQRAFAAEFLCPIEPLIAFLDGDFSSYAIEKAADKFDVSEMTVRGLLQNNGVTHPTHSHSLPYEMAA